MPVFNLKGEQTIMAQYVADFLPADSLKNFILGMQMAQATGMRHTLELARTRWPDATGVCYYKLTDNNPAASWATVDWYGVPKIAYHILRGAYRPLHVCLLFRRLAFIGVPIAFPIFLLDDDGALANTSWTVRVRAFDSDLKLIKRETFHGSGEQGPVARLGELALDTDQTWSCPLFITADISTDSGPQDSVFYWLNYAAIQGSLFDRPATQLAIRADERAVRSRSATSASRPPSAFTLTALTFLITFLVTTAISGSMRAKNGGLKSANWRALASPPGMPRV